MNFQKGLAALKKHAEEEWRIHQEILKETTGSAKHLVKKHWDDTAKIHNTFWKELKDAVKSK